MLTFFEKGCFPIFKTNQTIGSILGYYRKKPLILTYPRVDTRYYFV